MLGIGSRTIECVSHYGVRIALWSANRTIECAPHYGVRTVLWSAYRIMCAHSSMECTLLMFNVNELRNK